LSGGSGGILKTKKKERNIPEGEGKGGDIDDANSC